MRYLIYCKSSTEAELVVKLVEEYYTPHYSMYERPKGLKVELSNEYDNAVLIGCPTVTLLRARWNVLKFLKKKGVAVTAKEV